MKKYISILYLIFVFLLWGCQKEEELTPSYAEMDYFLPQASQTDEVSELKRQFFKDTGVKLLFSDTLYTSESDTILLDVDYNYVVDYTGYDYFIDQYTSVSEMKDAAEFVQNNILNEIGNILPPYSVILANDFVSVDYFGTTETLINLISLKTTVINLGDIEAKSLSEKEELKSAVLSQYLSYQLTTNYSNDLKPFFDVSSDIYDDWMKVWPTYTEDDQYNGFIEAPTGYSGFNRRHDIKTFLYYMYTVSEDDFRATYGDYTRIISKMEVLNSVLNEKFDIVIY
ncbi:hypothetical protein [Plebeiibacterium marinum]|uniref:Uncharacterized protein n=1 Tax=Plebeiibacterium marinum TaxID=2992111 RepID=A0AAE3MBW2_9BACT|nr:hypothetical protein [Plebeiobacterium marinum]MCW3804754.1 hypothetical protein [Plebeiobacterium marinum]